MLNEDYSPNFYCVRALLRRYNAYDVAWRDLQKALTEFRKFSLEEKQELAPDLLRYALNTRHPGPAQSELATLPQDWLRLHIEGWIREFLDPKDGFALQQLLLGLLDGVDRELAKKFAMEGLKNSDSYGKECAQEYLDELEEEAAAAQ